MYENNANGSKKRKREEKEKKKNERSGEKGLNKRVPFIRQRNFEVVCSRRVPCRRGWDARGPGRGKMNSTKGEKVTGKGPARDVLSGLVVRPSPPSGAAPAPDLPLFSPPCLFQLFYHTAEKSGHLANFRPYTLRLEQRMDCNIYAAARR